VGEIVRRKMSLYHAEIDCMLLNAFHGMPYTYLLAKELVNRSGPEYRELWLNDPQKALDMFMSMG